MSDERVLTRALLAFGRDAADERRWAERICQAYIGTLDVDGASISVLTASPARTTLWASDPTAQLIEELQFSLNEGACMDAAAHGQPVLVPEMVTGPHTRRWPMFTAALLERSPVKAIFALPLRWGAINLGVLDLYRETPGAMPEGQRLDAIAAADVAALILLGSRTDPGDGSWFDDADAGRAEVHQATGMVLAQLDVPPEDALARLRAVAFVEQRLLLDVARDVVARRRRFADDGEWV